MVAADRSRGGRDGTLAASPAWDDGLFGVAILFDGINDRVHPPALDAHTNQLTITCWARRQGAQDEFAGLVFSRAGSTVAGLSVRSSGSLRYTWNDDRRTYSFGSCLSLPDDQWAFAALVVERERATLYLEHTALLSAVSAIPHAPEEFDGRTVIGRDDLGGRQFQGWLDDVRIYGYALSAAEIARLAAGGGPADAPLPRDGSKVADAAGALEWWPGIGATVHDVYLGTSYAAARGDAARTRVPRHASCPRPAQSRSWDAQAARRCRAARARSA
jgi:hypothetical protein